MAQSLFPSFQYSDAHGAIDWLERVLGGKRVAVHEDDDGNVAHAEVEVAGGIVMLGSERAETDFPRGPGTVYVAVDEVDSRFEAAKAAGADIFRELTDQDYGSRDFAVRDPGGNVWFLGTYRPDA